MTVWLHDQLDRRGFGQAFGLGTAAGIGLLGGQAASSSVRRSLPALDLVTPTGRLHAFLKVYTSLTKKRVWYWYTGVIDAWLPGQPVVPICGVDTLIRRDITPLGGDRFLMEMFEGTYFHGLSDPAPLAHMVNPLNHRDVRPLHYREGPFRVGYDAHGPYDPATNKPYPGAPPFETRWNHSGEQLWFSRDNYIDAVHPLPMAQWPMESSGPRQAVGSFATHWAAYREVADPKVLTAHSDFKYEAFMDWLPWLLMGQAPGRMLWRASGQKLGPIADLPATARAGFLATHPSLFSERPWVAFDNMWIAYRATREPAGQR